MQNRKRNSRRGWLKGIPKKRTVKSVRDSDGDADGKALSSSPRPISATGEGEPKQKRAVTKTKESKDIYGSIQKGTTEGSEGHPNP